MSTTLQQFNELSAADAEAMLLTLCGSARWASALASRRPFEDASHLRHMAGNLWFYMDEADWLEAFACHPRIGEKPADGSAHAVSEQAAAQESLVHCAAALIAGNKAYEERFGFLYIVFANGSTAPELLAILKTRLANDRGTELHEAARQQAAITALRLGKWLGE